MSIASPKFSPKVFLISNYDKKFSPKVFLILKYDKNYFDFKIRLNTSFFSSFKGAKYFLSIQFFFSFIFSFAFLKFIIIIAHQNFTIAKQLPQTSSLPLTYLLNNIHRPQLGHLPAIISI